MTDLYVASASAVHALDRVTRGPAAKGRVLLVVQPRPHVREALRRSGLPGIGLYATTGHCVGVGLGALGVGGQPALRGTGRALGTLADDVANWQDWYRRSVVADALEALHESATAHRSGR